MSEEHRAKTRVNIPQLVVVFDHLTQSELGTVVNLHEEGFLLIGDRHVDEDHVYQLRFEMSAPIDGKTSLFVGAECLWVNETGSGDKVWAGFHIIDIEAEDSLLITHLIEQIGV